MSSISVSKATSSSKRAQAQCTTSPSKVSKSPKVRAVLRLHRYPKQLTIDLIKIYLFISSFSLPLRRTRIPNVYLREQLCSTLFTTCVSTVISGPRGNRNP